MCRSRVSDGGNVAWSSVSVRSDSEVSGREVRVREAPRRPGDPAVLVASSKRAREELGWRPRLAGLREIVASAWRWHRDHPRGFDRG